MVKISINNIKYNVLKGYTILEACKAHGIEIPTLCYLKEINEIGACRICLVEIKGVKKLLTSCNTIVWEGMEILTNTPRVREAREINLQLILSQHNSDCPTCKRNKNCALQNLCEKFNISASPYEKHIPANKSQQYFPLIREDSKCLNCLRCVNFCDKIQALGIWDFVGSGSHSKVTTASGKNIINDNCSLCGQCITHCPVGALHERDDTGKVLRAIKDDNKITVLQIAPAVRSAWGEGLSLDKDMATVKRMVAAAKALGFDYVFDTDFSADLTIMEEGSEFLARLLKGKGKLPLFTSCCPGWIRYIKSQYPEFLDNLSTAKSPQQMFGAITKTYFAKLLNVDPKNIYCVSAMPCTAKKAECDLPAMSNAVYGKDVDASITTREFNRMISAGLIDVKTLTEQEFDTPLGLGSGAGVIFGSSGGVMEAALRTAYSIVTGKNPEADAFKELRGSKGVREYGFEINGMLLKVAVASGLSNAKKIMEALKKGEVYYDFVEIMACPGGCAGGGGQPIHNDEELAAIRSQMLYSLDNCSNIRFAHENVGVQGIYDDFLDEPNSPKAHELLHTNHRA